MIRFVNAELYRGPNRLLEAMNLTIHARQKVGLVGDNGCGKSSLFALLLGQLTPEQGMVDVPSHLTIAHLAQETPALQQTALDYVLDGDTLFRELETAIKQTQDGQQLAHLHQRFDEIEGYSVPARAAQLLAGLGFKPDQQQKVVADFSGGWRMRLNLAQTLMQRSDLLLLDEPTNHLDIDAILWLEQWLIKYPGTLILISHDRDFLDNTVSHIAHIHGHQIKLYSGNYTQFEILRSEELALQQAMQAKQQKRREHLQSYVDRFRYKASKAKQAQSRLKMLERMQTIAIAHADTPFNFSFKVPPKQGNPLIHLDDIDIGYSQQPLLQRVNLNITPGQRIGLLGPNGAGKSTLIKLLVGMITPLRGIKTASPHLKIGYFAQHQLEYLRLDESPVQHIQRESPQESEQSIRQFLGGFNFSGDKAVMPIKHFSGGEKSRLALAIIVWQNPNLLLLDEPTNHLDLAMREALAEALQTYSGAMIIVSHDRHLIRSSCDELMLIANGSLQPFTGDLQDYLSVIKQGETATNKNTTSGYKDRRKLDNQNKKLEKQLTEVAEKLASINADLAQPALYQDENLQEKLFELQRQQKACSEQLEQLELEWLAVQEQLEQR